ncbi:MAG: hypothetical protein QG608_1503 [Actinomycetota bacterium]|nr:hypothetical protein [Actinomycetota bacterium]
MAARKALACLAAFAAVGTALIVLPSTASAALPDCIKSIHLKTDAIVPASSSGLIDCVMSKGADNIAVVALQASLVYCNGENITVDGVFGTPTEAALKRVQKKAGVSADGIYNPKTRKAILHNTEDGYCIRIT